MMLSHILNLQIHCVWLYHFNTDSFYEIGFQVSAFPFRSSFLWFLSQKVIDLFYGGFHLHLLVFPFIYQFNYRIEALVCSSFANDYFRRISPSFHHHFKICLLWYLHEKEYSFYIYFFYCTEMK